MDQIAQKILRFDRFTLDLTRGFLRGGHQDIELRPKTFEVLRYLAENAGRLVLKQELSEAVWPNVVVTDDSLVQCIRELRRALGDDEHRLIKTVPRRGYLLNTTITTPAEHGAVSDDDAHEAAAVIVGRAAIDGAVGRRYWARWRWPMVGSTILIVAALIVAGLLSESTRPSIRTQADTPVGVFDRRSSIVILPFQNLGGDPEQEYFADAITNDLTNGMSRLPVTLIAGNTAFTYKGKPIDVRQIGRELGVRYVVEGTVRRSGDNVGVTARLIDAPTATNVWAESFEIDRHDLARLRDDVTARLTRVLSVELIYARGARSLRERPHNPEAVDFLMRANALWARTPKGRDVSEPRRLFREALQRDDSLAYAWSGLAMTYLREVRFSPTHQQDLLYAGDAAQRAMVLDPDSAWSHLATGWVLYERKRMDQALAAFEHAAQLDPDLPFAQASVAAANLMRGQSENALEPLRKAMRLSPKDPDLPNWQMFLGAVYLHLGRDREAVDWLTKSMVLNPGDLFTRLFLASALALSGREDEAKVEVAGLLQLKPDFTLSYFKAAELSDAPAFRAQRERIYEGLLRAGVPK
jgi:adenylate cyclase